jgi:hypothetical protein
MRASVIPHRGHRHLFAAPLLFMLSAEEVSAYAYRERLCALCKHHLTFGPPNTEALVKRDVERWTKLLHDAGILLD